MERITGYPAASSQAASAVMRGNRRTDTGPEVRLRSALFRLGLRYRKDFPIPTAKRRVRADIVFTRAKVAVFVDGCFWHACPQHGTSPKSNAAYWTAKFERNVARDREVDVLLGDAGWRVLRVWEHDVDTAAALIAQVVSDEARPVGASVL